MQRAAAADLPRFCAGTRTAAALARSLPRNKAMDWFVKKSYLEDVFMQPDAALDWLCEHVPVDRAALVNAVLRDVPAGQRDPGFIYLQTARVSANED